MLQSLYSQTTRKVIAKHSMLSNDKVESTLCPFLNYVYLKVRGVVVQDNVDLEYFTSFT